MFRIKSYFIDSLEETSTYIFSFNLAIVVSVFVGFTAAFLFWTDEPQNYKLIIIGLTNLIVLVSLCMGQFWISRFQVLYRWYSLIFLSYISFFFFYISIQNHLSDQNNLSEQWILPSLAGLILVILLAYEWLIALVSIITGIITSIVFAVPFTHLLNITDVAVTNHVIQLIQSDSTLTYALLLLTTGLLSFKRNRIFQQKINLFKALSGSIVHEITTPLSCITVDAGQIIETTENWQNDTENEEARIKDKDLLMLTGLAKDIEHMVMQTQILTKIQLVNIRGVQGNNKQTNEIFSMVEIINGVLKDYAYITRGITIIFNANSNFKINAIKTLFIFTLLNLLKNAVYAVKHKNNRLIEIWLNGDKRQAYFKDYGTGIPKTKLRKLFTSFNTSKVYGEGTGLGLFFCKQVMTNLGGSIECSSIVNEYTQFTLSFPKLDAE